MSKPAFATTNVEVEDAVFLLECFDGGEGVLFDGGVVFDEDEGDVFSFGEVVGRSRWRDRGLRR